MKQLANMTKKFAATGGAILLLLFFLFSAIPAAAAETAERLGFDDMYAGATALGIKMSDKLKSLDGHEVEMQGFMAPPLKPTMNFFVLTRVPMSICPFCSSDADWPYDIVVVYLDRKVVALPYDRPIRVRGRLEIGTKVDDETQFVSLVRIYADAESVEEAE